MDKRAKFDFAIEFTNGGGLQGQDFRLDIAGDNITDQELADYLVQDMRLLLVGKVTILNKTILAEPHKRPPINPAPDRRAYIDLSHTIEHGMITYKGLPAPLICDYLSREDSRKFYAPGTEFQIGKIELVTNTGTYLDCPFHRYAHGKDLAQLELEQFTDLEAVVIRAVDQPGLAIDVAQLRGHELRNRAVLVHTGWAQHWRTDQYFENHPFLTEDAAKYLTDCGAKLVGIDSHNIDDTRGRTRPVHSTLLGADILICEHLCNLEQLPNSRFTFSAIPPKFSGVGTFPVRALAKVRE